MCGGNELANAFAHAPVNGLPTGGSSSGGSISLEEARISVAWCAQQMTADCSTHFVGITKNTGQCHCAKSSSADTECASKETANHFFERMLPECTVTNSNKLPGTACECLPGFKGSITWSNRVTTSTCTPTQCTGLSSFTDGTVTTSRGDLYGSVATFACNHGFKLQDTPPITCNALNADTTWPTNGCTGVLLRWS